MIRNTPYICINTFPMKIRENIINTLTAGGRNSPANHTPFTSSYFLRFSNTTHTPVSRISVNCWITNITFAR